MHSFGTDRTFTLIGILGYVLYVLDTENLHLFLAGLVIITAFLGIYYIRKIQDFQRYGITAILTALITYCLAPLIYNQPQYVVLLIVVALLIVTEIKENLSRISRKFDNTEFVTLAKFLVLAGVILPLLPHTPIAAGFTISAYNFWLSIVVVSAISYFSYLLQKFVFPHSGLLLTGLLGGLYSSTATCIILARKSKQSPGNRLVVPAMMLAICMMYLRIFLLALFFNQHIATVLLPYFITMIVICATLAVVLMRFHQHIAKGSYPEVEVENQQHNPLEFKTAFVFGLLFVLFTVITHYVLRYYGTAGLHSIALLVGVTDIDPFILNLLQGNWHIAHSILAAGIILAINSNNVAKMAYSLVLGDQSLKRLVLIAYTTLVLTGFAMYLIRPFG